ncbi:unnamed protein product [Rhodiola kirilowii]
MDEVPVVSQYAADNDKKKKRRNRRSKNSSGMGCLVPEKGYVPSKQFKDPGQKIFIPHWSAETAFKAIEKGNAFKGIFRVNGHNRFEAYCKIDGVPVDILINGLAAQNRAVEGDIVAIQVDPLSCWTKMEGSAAQSIGSVSAEGPTIAADVNERTMMGIVEQGIHDINICRGESSDTGKGEGWISQVSKTDERIEVAESVRKICCNISSCPLKRPTGKVVAILERSSRRDSIIGHLSAKKCVEYLDQCKRHYGKSTFPLAYHDYIELMPADPKFSKMVVPVENLPHSVQKRLVDGDTTLQMEIVAAKIDCWREDDPFPRAQVTSTFGRAGEIETHVASILFENNICCSEFSAESLSCLPDVPWSIPQVELENRKDIRNKCIFTIDPPTATDLDDALSFENLSNGNFRIGVHIADVSYFVLPDSALDKEAQERSTNVYMLQQKLPMLPPLLSEEIGSLNPGVDRLAFSIFWEISPDGVVINQWLGRTIICSCCKLSYAHAQNIIDSEYPCTASYPILRGNVEWPEVIGAVKKLHKVSKKLKEKRFINGALRLDGPYDDFGIPYDGMMSERYDANFLVEEFMILANRTAAEVISRAYPDNALLQRHPEPNMRKLRELEAFCCKHGLDVDISSSGQLHESLERIKQKIGDDNVLFDIIVNYAIKPMQLAAYFCSGDQKIDVHDWGHYALAVPLYTHFTSPLRRYVDIVVHRTLAAVIEAEHVYSKHHPSSTKVNNMVKRCFTGATFDKSAADSLWGKEALSAAALKHKVPHAELLVEVASHCNERKLASKSAQDACHRLYMWVLLKNKQDECNKYSYNGNPSGGRDSSNQNKVEEWDKKSVNGRRGNEGTRGNSYRHGNKCSGPSELTGYDICFTKTETTVTLKPSLFAKNREKRNETKRATEGRRGEILQSGLILLKNHLSITEQAQIVNICRKLGQGHGGFYQPGYQDGAKLHLKMMCLGKNWDPETSQYVDVRPVDGAKPPPLPFEFSQLVHRAIQESHQLIKEQMKTAKVENILPSMSPDLCIVNFYTASGRLGLHQDRDESEESLMKGLPVVSFSIGDTAVFLYSEQQDVGKADKVLLESGDVLLFGGRSRHIFHGVEKIYPNTAPKSLLGESNLRPGRLNLTFRQF